MRIDPNFSLRELTRALTAWDPDYDPVERMIRRPFSSPGYHTTLVGGTVHPTRESLSYALALLDSGEPERLSRAVAILDRVLALQDTDPESPTYGLWPWFLEEPLSQMSPPDWNWADFCGTSLIQIAMDHRARLPASLAQRLDQATIHAARSIQRRDVDLYYTNIALMGTYVTYTVGEFYQMGDLLDYARSRLRRFYEYTRAQGAFTEFNSPTYTAVAIRVLARMRRDIRDPEAHPMLDWLYDLAWADVARHFHPPTRQWVGPHSRAYATLLRPGEQAFLQRATRGALRFFADDALPPDIEAHRLDFACPSSYIPSFLRLEGPREIVQVYYQGGGWFPRIIGRTYMDETLAIGTMNRGDFWDQRRPLVAYWGTAEHPTALQVRCLHDGYDYSSALLFSRQAGPYVLAAVIFATDHGDRHFALDPIRDQAIFAKDLRLRFQVIHPPAGWHPPASLNLRQIQSLTIGEVTLSLHVAHIAFGDFIPYGEVTREGDDGCPDLVLYHGPERRIDFAKLASAGIVFGLQITPARATVPLPAVQVSRVAGRLVGRWKTPHGLLELAVPERPGPFAELQQAAENVDDA